MLSRLLKFVCAPERSWTVTTVAGHRILSPACLPVPPPGQPKKNCRLFAALFQERKTGLEPATLTLARLCSTKWATSAFCKNCFEECKNSNLHFTTKFLSVKFIYTVACTKYCPAPLHQDDLCNDAHITRNNHRAKKQLLWKPAYKKGNGKMLPNYNRIPCLYNPELRFPYLKFAMQK